MIRILIAILLVFSNVAFAKEYVSPTLIPIIEEQPPMVIKCRVQALIIPNADPDPRNEWIITTELLEKGIKVDHILANDRVKQGAFYFFGEINETVLSHGFNITKHKLKVAAQLRVAMFTSFNYKTIEASIKLLGCSITYLY